MNRIVPALVAASLTLPGAAFAQSTGTTNPSGNAPVIANPGGVSPGGVSPSGITPGAGPAGTTTPTTGSTSAAGGVRPGTAPMGAAPAPTFGGNQGQANGTAPAGVATTANPSRTTAAPVAGANSFTMGQARSRLQRGGYTQVTGLHKDSRGVWRGKAMKDGQPASVSLDYQGNVVGK